MVSPRICNHEKSRLLERCLDLVSEVSKSEAASNRNGSSGSSKLQHSPQASILGGNDADVHWAFNDNDGMSCRQKLLQGSLQIYDVDVMTFPFVDMLFHLKVKVGAT